MRVESDIWSDARQDVIGGKKGTISLAEEANLSIGVSRSPDHALVFAHQVNILTILDQRECLMGWD